MLCYTVPVARKLKKKQQRNIYIAIVVVVIGIAAAIFVEQRGLGNFLKSAANNDEIKACYRINDTCSPADNSDCYAKEVDSGANFNISWPFDDGPPLDKCLTDFKVVTAIALWLTAEEEHLQEAKDRCTDRLTKTMQDNGISGVVNDEVSICPLGQIPEVYIPPTITDVIDSSSRPPDSDAFVACSAVIKCKPDPSPAPLPVSYCAQLQSATNTLHCSQGACPTEKGSEQVTFVCPRGKVCDAQYAYTPGLQVPIVCASDSDSIDEICTRIDFTGRNRGQEKSCREARLTKYDKDSSGPEYRNLEPDEQAPPLSGECLENNIRCLSSTDTTRCTAYYDLQRCGGLESTIKACTWHYTASYIVSCK